MLEGYSRWQDRHRWAWLLTVLAYFGLCIGAGALIILLLSLPFMTQEMSGLVVVGWLLAAAIAFWAWRTLIR